MDWAIWYLQRRFGDVQHLTTDTASKSIDEFVVVDARRSDEFDVSHIPNAQRLHFRATDCELQSFVDAQLSNSGRQIVCYCSVGWRSALLVRRLNAMIRAKNCPEGGGEVKVYNMAGSIFKWANEGRPLVDGRGNSTQTVHPFNSIFSFMLDADKRQWPD